MKHLKAEISEHARLLLSCQINRRDGILITEFSTEVHAARVSKLRVNCFGVSVDGFGAGPGQNLENPLGVGGMGLHEWVFPTRMFQRMLL